MKSVRCLVVPLFITVLLGSSHVMAQSFIMRDIAGDRPRIGVRFMRPAVDGVDLSAMSGAFDLSFTLPLSPSTAILASLPFSTIAAEGWDRESGIGNIFLGLQAHIGSSDIRTSAFTVGLFIPTAGENKWDANIIGMFSNYHEFQKYIPHTLTAYVNQSVRFNTLEGAIFGIEAGANILIPTEDQEYRDTDMFARYGLTGGVSTSGFAFLFELTGLVWLSGDFVDFGDRFYHSLAFGAQYTGIPLRPGIFYMLYLKDVLSDDVDGVLGFKLEFVVP
ncbi:MAG: hypothetical protein JSV33_14765 [bacterium]|nr:MAG: hypothetical protein JSV33_14765 [bacterium]